MKGVVAKLRFSPYKTYKLATASSGDSPTRGYCHKMHEGEKLPDRKAFPKSFTSEGLFCEHTVV